MTHNPAHTQWSITRNSISQAMLIIPLLLSMCLSSCGIRKSESGEPDPIYESDSSAMAPFLFEKPLIYCTKKPEGPWAANVQVLIDASGSMVGFSGVVRDMIGWIKSSLSQMQGSSVNIGKYRLAQFNKPKHIFNETAWGKVDPAFSPSGDTNLHEAIRATDQFDLTIIITDGVAATGQLGGSDCAGGVDAACVARAFYEAVHPSDGHDGAKGIWILPIAAIYDGKYYSEEKVTNFSPKQTISNVQADVGQVVTIGGVATTPTGELTYNYRGPRAALLLVIARNEEIGRNAVEALWSAAQRTGVQIAGNYRDFAGRVASFTPVEIFPGFIYPVTWSKVEEKSSEGNLDASLEASLKGTSIKLSHPQDTESHGVFTLVGSPSVPVSGAGCVPLLVIPSFRVNFEIVGGGPETRLNSLVTSFKRVGQSHLEVELEFTCNKETDCTCDNNPLHAQYFATTEYKNSADCFADGENKNPGIALIRGISTSHPSLEPHRIYNFSELIKLFYLEVASDQRRVALSNVDFCIN